MLELRPSCEHCARTLPPESDAARICSFECTFCCTCVDEVLHNVCPNCGGGFVPRPVRPAHGWVRGNSVNRFPARADPVHQPVDLSVHADLLNRLSGIEPTDR